MVRQKRCKVGHGARVYRVRGRFRLPEGLPNGARVRTIDVSRIEVEDRGRPFRVATACIESGWLPVISAPVCGRRQNW